jgi:hypothetical protein
MAAQSMSRVLAHVFLVSSLVMPPGTAVRAAGAAPDTPEGQPPGMETAFGLHTASFATPHGLVRVNLPDDLTAGDTISGTVLEEPAGTSDGEKARNQDELSGYVVELEKQPSPVDKEQPQWTVPAGLAAAAVPLVLRDRQGREVARVSVPLQKAPPAGAAPLAADFALPSVGQAGKPVEVRGPFDGRSAETAVKVAGQAARVLAESPRKAVVQTPPGMVGAVDLEVSKGGRTARCTYRSLGVKLSAPKTSLLKGEQTTMTVAVSGLSGADKPVQLVLTNRTPANVTMSGGDRQELSVPPSANGTFVGTRMLTGVRSGGFSVNAVVRDVGAARQACASPSGRPDVPTSPTDPWYQPAGSPGGTGSGGSQAGARVDRPVRPPQAGQPEPPTAQELERSRATEATYRCLRAFLFTSQPSGAYINSVNFGVFDVRVGTRSCSYDFFPVVVSDGVQHTIHGAERNRNQFVPARVTSCEAWDEPAAALRFPPHSFGARIAVPSLTGSGEAEVGMNGTVTNDGQNLQVQVRWLRLFPGDRGTPRSSSLTCALVP